MTTDPADGHRPPPDPSLRDRASAAVRAPGTWAVLRLLLVAFDGLVLLALEALNLDRQVDVVLFVVAGLAWLGLLATYWWGLSHAEDRGRFALTHGAYPVLLLAPLLVGRELSWSLFLLVVLAYVLELRNVAAGHAFGFSFGLVVFVGVLAAAVMVEFEKDQPDSQLRTPGDATLWAFASLLRVNYGRSLNPVTADGRLLATVIGVCAVLAASLFTAQVVAWVVGNRDDDADGRGRGRSRHRSRGEAEALDRMAAELAALRAGMDGVRADMDGVRADLDEMRTMLQAPAGAGGTDAAPPGLNPAPDPPPSR